MAKRVILDTDIGTDVDDCLALALVLSSPELTLEGVTCVYGDVLLRARMVMKLLSLRGVTNVPVMMGATKPLMGLRPVYWEGHEGRGLLTRADNALQPAPQFGPDYIVQTVMQSPGEIHLLAIGPLTNVALAFIQEPRLAEALASLTIMGGVMRSPNRLDLPYTEHNIVSDPEAAHVVFSSGAPINLVPLDLTVQVRIQRPALQRIRAAGTPFHRAVGTQLELYPRFARFGETNMHDPLAVATTIERDLLTWQPAHIDVETGGRLTAGMTLMRSLTNNDTSRTSVGVAVDIERAQEFIIGRITSNPASA